MTATIYSLIPPIVAILMVILTRKVLPSLGVGIISAALILHVPTIQENGVGTWLVDSFLSIWNSLAAIFIDDGAIATSTVYILLFLLLLGMITVFISISGGSRAFGEWAMKRVKTRVGAKLTAFVLGIVIFIDDYFNALAVGQVSRPLTDRQRVSRAKLAYIIDSTSAPICVVSPVSSWGASIIGIIGTIIVAHNMTDITAFSAFIQMIPMNLYVITTLIMVLGVSLFNINIGPMKKHEERAMTTGEVVDPSKPVLGALKEDLPTNNKGTIGDLIWPIIALVVGTVGSMIWTGILESEKNASLIDIFGNAAVAPSLLYGGLLGLAVTLVLFFIQARVKKNIESTLFSKAVIEGIKSMLPAVYILVFAWVIVDLISQLGTGQYLAIQVENSNLNTAFLPVILFVVAGLMAFSTGTSWGTFGVMLPIAGDIITSTDATLLLPTLAAVLAGSVFGDHCSPISDTTILSSTGAGSHHIDHVLTQIPYAIISAVIAMIGYVVLGFTGSTIAGVIVSVTLIVLFILLFRKKSTVV
ncbi:Na+/H+ antiporter NhaC family protein [Bacillus sp. PS06]|uniref:Na+/H+ antiporter NhaC family protein n=1 Tax=Bacillus sp. PS06 TaxID=2764176 RepID=UPI00178471D7|nr:Na+/H+ antiporter NhaC family protein [Bacillus sp. PS06]MBD8070444.1 Na+/H+ antiporter NhaC family protein [Bacillus sp. PS06]